MSLPKFTSHMISKQPDQTAYLLNKLVQEGVGGTGGGDIKLYTTTGQHTDGAMTQKATTDALGTKADTITVGNQLAGKVDKETGKGLSSNDFTDEELAKLNGIQAGAQVNVQSDWDQTNTSADDYIKNKPTLATVATSGDYDDLLNKPVIPPGAVLYSTTGQNTDGAMTQKASTDLFNEAAYIGTGSVGTLSPWVDTSDLVDGAVTTAKIASGAVTSDKIDFTTSGTLSSINFETGYSMDAGSSFLRKFGNIVFWQIHLSRASTYPTSSTIVATMPSGYRPSKYTVGWGSSTAGDNIYVMVTPEGYVRTSCKTALATTINVYIGGVFLTD